MGAASSHEVAAFSRDLDRSTRLAAERAWVICADLRGLLLGVSALGILTAGDRAESHDVAAAAILERIVDVKRRLYSVDGLDRARLDALRAATGDLERAVRDVATAGSSGRVTPWAALTDCYAAMEQLRRGLWAFELRPEGAPLSAAARASYDEGFVSGVPPRA